MGRFDSTKTAIDVNITQNGNQEITGSILNSVLNNMVDATDAQLDILQEAIPTKLSDLEQDIQVYDDTEIRQELSELSAETKKVFIDSVGSANINIPSSENGWHYYTIPVLTSGNTFFLELALASASDYPIYWKINGDGEEVMAAKTINASELISKAVLAIEKDYESMEIGVYSSTTIPDLSFIVNLANSALGKIEYDIDGIKDNALLASTKILSHNVYNPAKAEIGYYYRWNDGAIVERSDIASTGLIPCKGGDVIYVSVNSKLQGGNVTYWDKYGNFLEGVNMSTSPFTIPNNNSIAYFRTSCYSYNADKLCVNIGSQHEYDVYREEVSYKTDLPIIAPNIEDIKNVAESSLQPSLIVLSHNVYNPAKAEIGYYYRWNDGAIVERSDIASTGLIPCKGGDVVYAFRLTAYYGGNVTCWDKDGKFVSGFNATTSPYTIPNNGDIAYFRTSFYNSIVESFCVNINEKYDDDKYQEENAYKSEIPVYAPNINAGENAGIVKYYSMTRDSVTSIYGRNNDYGTSFIFSVIAKKNYEDAAILPRLKGTSDTSELGDNNCTTVLAYAKKHQYQHIINAGIFLVADNTADGITIMNGNILKDGVCEQFDVEQYVLGIKANGEMKSYRGMTAQQILDDGCIDAVTGFVPLFENSAAVDNTILSICPHYNIKHPRQIVGILSTGDFFTFCCDGRTDGEEGMTLKECINTLSELASIKYAFNLDGGGSTQTATYHKEVNRRLDGRKVPNVIAFVA